MTIPVIILNWNGIQDTLKSVNSVLNQTYKDYHIYLIDNDSENAEGELLKSQFHDCKDVTFIQNTSNLGFARAHNEAFKKILSETNYKYIALLNNDAFAKPEWLEHMVICAEKHSAHMVSSKMLFYERPDRINNLGHKFLNTGEILPIAWDEPATSNTKLKENAGASGGACLYSCEMLKDIDLFDEYFITGYEDAELGVRAMVAGYKLMYEPQAVVLHKVGASINKIRTYEYTLKLQLDLIYAYFKLMPTTVIIWNLPAVIFRTAILFTLFTLWGRWTYLKIFFHGWYLILTRDYSILRDNRRRFKSKRRMSWVKIISKQEFFLIDNVKRFITYFIKGEKTIFEKFE